VCGVSFCKHPVALDRLLPRHDGGPKCRAVDPRGRVAEDHELRGMEGGSMIGEERSEILANLPVRYVSGSRADPKTRS
jgi:hypothetical protein